MGRSRFSKKTSPLRLKKSVMVILPRMDVTEFLRQKRRRSLSMQQNVSTTSNVNSPPVSNVPSTATARLRRRFRVKPEPPCLFHSQVEITDESVEEIPVLVGDPLNPCHMCSPRHTEDKSQVWNEITIPSQSGVTSGYKGWHVPTPFVPSAPPNIETRMVQTTEAPLTETAVIEAPLTRTISNEGPVTQTIEAPPTRTETKDQATQTVRHFVCKQCPALFTDVMHLIHHKSVHQKMFECPFCTANFVSKNDLKSHMKLHMLPKYYDCVYCNQAFTKKWDIREHLALHLDQKQFHCQQCPAKFTQKINLRNHEQSHKVNVSKFIHVFKKIDDDSTTITSPSKANRRSGSICAVEKIPESTAPKPPTSTPKPTSSTSYLALSSITDMNTPSTIPEPSTSVSAATTAQTTVLPERGLLNFFQCQFCPLSFKHRSFLQRHSLCHIRKSGKFVCTKCGGRFLKKVGLVVHTKHSHIMN